MRVDKWICVYIDYHDKSHSWFCDSEEEARQKARIIKKRIQQSSANDTVRVLERDDVYMMASEFGTQEVLVMSLNVSWSDHDARNGVSAVH